MKLHLRAVAALLALVCAPAAHATLISYSAQHVADTTWRYEYSVTNDSLGEALAEFTIYFDLGLFDNLQV